MFGSSHFIAALARRLLLPAAMVGLLASQGFSALAAAPDKQQRPSRFTASNRAGIERLLQLELQNLVDNQERLPGQDGAISVRVRVDVATGIVVIELGKTYVPRGYKHLTEDLGEMLREVTGAAEDLLNGIVDYKHVTIRIDGKPLSEVFPDDYAPSRSGVLLPAAVNPGLVVVNPGHGQYFHYGSQAWEFQRPVYAGSTDVREDTLMPSYSTDLTSLLINRGYDHVTTVANTRDVLNTQTDPASGRQWRQLASRYSLARWYPDMASTMWGMFPNGIAPDRVNLREYDDDIRARPEYANHLGAETLISLHTNGSDNPDIRGAQAYAQETRPESWRLAESVLCYMKEKINAVPAYASYQVDRNPRNSNHGENTRADMTSILLELGFHTNTEDSAALRNSTFRIAAMKGVEKGYRMYALGKPCETLAITSIPHTSGAFFTYFRENVHFSGTPQLPLRLSVQYTGCPTGWNCSPYTVTFRTIGVDGESPLYYSHRCTAPSSTPSATFSIRSVITDADGVKSAPFDSTYSCTNPVAGTLARSSEHRPTEPR